MLFAFLAVVKQFVQHLLVHRHAPGGGLLDLFGRLVSGARCRPADQLVYQLGVPTHERGGLAESFLLGSLLVLPGGGHQFLQHPFGGPCLFTQEISRPRTGLGARRGQTLLPGGANHLQEELLQPSGG